VDAIYHCNQPLEKAIEILLHLKNLHFLRKKIGAFNGSLAKYIPLIE